jgi:hypothetical protein
MKNFNDIIGNRIRDLQACSAVPQPSAPPCVPTYGYTRVPLQAWTDPDGFSMVEAPRFQDNRHMKVVRLSALLTGRLYPPGNIPGTHFCLRLSQPQGHSAAGRIMSMKNSNYTIGNRTCNLPAYNTVPKPTAPPAACPPYMQYI